MGMRALAVLLLPAVGAGPQEEGDERTLVLQQLEGEIPRKWAAAEEEGDWRKRLELFTVAQRDYREKLLQPDPDAARWLRVPEVLARRLDEAPPNVREPFEIVARQAFEAAEDRGAREAAIERYAFTGAALQARVALANRDFDAGRMRDAVRGWSLALEVRFSPEIAARLGHAHALLGDAPALAALRAQARSAAWQGDLELGGRAVDLLEYLDSLRAAPLPAAPPLFKPSAVPSNEVTLGRFEFRTEGGVYGRGQAGSIPAWGRVEGRELLFFTNGMKLVAVDPVRAEGGPLEEAVEWRFPKDGTTRYSMPTHAVSSAYPVPLAGAVVSGDVVYATMFTKDSQVDKQPLPERRRYGTRFEGPGALRAFRAATGEPLWDTERLEVERGGERAAAFDRALGGLFNYCFAGPPLVRGDRLYAAIMTSPMVGRYCWAACLDAATGLPLWCTPIAKAPAKREMMSVAAIAEEEGTLAVLTNFGVAASLDARTGRIEWLAKYGQSTGFARRAVNPPVILGSVVLMLPQDTNGLLAYDRWTGREAALPDLGEVSWSGVDHLLGKSGDWIVLAGPKCYAVRPSDGKVLCLLEIEPARHGRGALAGGLLYLPGRTALHLFETRGWKPVGTVPWAEGEETGNLLVTDSLMAWLGDRFELYTSRAALGERFSDKVKAGHAPTCRQMGRILESSGRLAEAVLYYRKALAVWEQDPAWAETSEGLRKKIAELQERIDAEPGK